MARGGSFLDKLLFGYRTIQWNGVPLSPETTANFIGATLVIDNPSMGRTDITVGSGGGSSGGSIVLVENNGAPMPFEPAINFVGFTLADDQGNSRTNVSANPPGTLNVAGGGTGQSSLTSHAVLLGAGTSPLHFASPTSAGFVLTDNGPGADPTFQPPTGGGGSSDMPAPGTPLNSSSTIAATQTWTEIQAVVGGYSIDVRNVVVGRIYRFTHVGGAAGTNQFGTAGQAVTLTRGTGSFLIADPQQPITSTASSVLLTTSGVTYNFALDSPSSTGVFRSVGMS